MPECGSNTHCTRPDEEEQGRAMYALTQYYNNNTEKNLINGWQGMPPNVRYFFFLNAYPLTLTIIIIITVIIRSVTNQAVDSKCPKR